MRSKLIISGMLYRHSVLLSFSSSRKYQLTEISIQRWLTLSRNKTSEIPRLGIVKGSQKLWESEMLVQLLSVCESLLTPGPLAPK